MDFDEDFSGSGSRNGSGDFLQGSGSHFLRGMTLVQQISWNEIGDIHREGRSIQWWRGVEVTLVSLSRR